jgi:hypothetical protein
MKVAENYFQAYNENIDWGSPEYQDLFFQRLGHNANIMWEFEKCGIVKVKMGK